MNIGKVSRAHFLQAFYVSKFDLFTFWNVNKSINKGDLSRAVVFKYESHANFFHIRCPVPTQLFRNNYNIEYVGFVGFYVASILLREIGYERFFSFVGMGGGGEGRTLFKKYFYFYFTFSLPLVVVCKIFLNIFFFLGGGTKYFWKYLGDVI